MIGFDATITLFLKLHAEPRQKVVLHNCYWGRDTGKVTVGTVQLATNDIVVKILPDKNFLPIDEWRALEDKGDHWSIDTQTVIFLGEADLNMSENPNVPNSKTRAQFITMFKDRGIFTVSSFANNVRSVGGREMKTSHYMARGAAT